MMVPNYQAGRDAAEGFRRHYRVEVLEAIYVSLANSTCHKYGRVFIPGGMGVTLVRQFSQSGMAESVPFLSVWTVDETMLPATQEAPPGSAALPNGRQIST